MNINNIYKNENFYFVSGEKTTKDTSYYSLLIGVEAYLKTYYAVAMSLSCACDNEKWINDAASENNKYIECYLNITIHIQHFFELEIKRILENKHILYAIDAKGDPLITHKLLQNIEMKFEDLENMKSIEFSDALNRLTKLVNNNIIDDQVARIFVDNNEILKELNFLRNTTLHRGRRVMKYCTLDKLFVQRILPLIKKVLEQPYYNFYRKNYIDYGVYKILEKIILEGNESSFDYSRIAFLKEIGRCKLELVSRPKLDESEDKEYIEKTIDKKMTYTCGDVRKLDKKCPCCQNYTIFEGQELMGYSLDELGDEMGNGPGFQIIHVPVYEQYIECAWCGFMVSSFVSLRFF